MKPLLIVVEGLDGCGKSTLAHGLAKALGAVQMTTPSDALRSLRGEILDGLRHDPLAVELFYAATVQAASAEIGEHLSAGRSVVVDRYWLSTVVYARQRRDFAELLEIERRLLPADVTVWLDVPLSVRRARLEARGQSAADRETLSEEMDAALRRGYLAASRRPVVGRFHRLDAGSMTPGALVAAVRLGVMDALASSAVRPA
ncbi:MAG: dTMP kinase [Myxococcota bacterium]|jgi:dTMP kinase